MNNKKLVELLDVIRSLARLPYPSIGGSPDDDRDDRDRLLLALGQIVAVAERALYERPATKET